MFIITFLVFLFRIIYITLLYMLYIILIMWPFIVAGFFLILIIWAFIKIINKRKQLMHSWDEHEKNIYT
jgi:hypothetical protein